MKATVLPAKAMQKVVNHICVVTDTMYEWIIQGEKEWMDEFSSLMLFLKASKERGFNVDAGFYSYEDKISVLNIKEV